MSVVGEPESEGKKRIKDCVLFSLIDDIAPIIANSLSSFHSLFKLNVKLDAEHSFHTSIQLKLTWECSIQL